ncbi:hypothetical protein LR948_00890 [Roseivivax sp. GX 12232]|uniref:hypothetical protein n=1 Tax=Roseivivax sp. GX 12232 TaxID=2900547 RepID=UPI001E34727B|nr:hypothetical protein [Roseivivax sp. GX 12232]MCE0503900.1 hypothetical protein [Roseivivax sp. GX 12232]
MVTEHLLDMIWDGRLRPAPRSQTQQIAHLLRRLLPVSHAEFLFADKDVAQITVIRDDVMLDPDLALGDVLVEEFDLRLPAEALVVILPAPQARTALCAGRSAELSGRIAARAATVLSGTGPEDARGTHGLCALWHCYETLIDMGYASIANLDLVHFTRGFTRELRQMSGAEAASGGILSGTFLPDHHIVQTAMILKAVILGGHPLSFELFRTLTRQPEEAITFRSLAPDSMIGSRV